MKDLKNCPICGRKPRFAIGLESMDLDTGLWVKVKCHRFLHPCHMKVEIHSEPGDKFEADAIRAWNNAVKCYENTHPKKNKNA